MEYLLAYLLLINAAGFLFMHIDKEKARKNKWRISEAFLLSLAALGGSIGTLLGVYIFHHKTKHLKFYAGVPLLMGLQFLLFLMLYKICFQL